MGRLCRVRYQSVELWTTPTALSAATALLPATPTCTAEMLDDPVGRELHAGPQRPPRGHHHCSRRS